MKLKVQYLENYNKEWGLISSEEGDSGYDLRAAIENPITLARAQRVLIPTGIKASLNAYEALTTVKLKESGAVVARMKGEISKQEILKLVSSLNKDVEITEEDFDDCFSCTVEKTSVIGSNAEIQIRPRSGLAVRNGVSIVNTPGTVDYSYRGQLCVILINLGNEDFIINPGDRIAQMVVCPIYKPEIVEVESLDNTGRGENGFGSSGVE